MYYTRLKPEIESEEMQILQDNYDIRLYDSPPPELSEDSLLSFVNTTSIKLDAPGGCAKDKLLLFNPELATWVFLEGKERILYDYLHDNEGVQYSTLLTASLLKLNGLGGAERLNTILGHLYYRGLISVDGQTGLNQEIYRQGPLFNDIPMMEFLVTKRCNLECRYCFAKANESRRDMSLETAFKAVDHLMKMPFRNYYIKFSGGEPLLRKDFLEKVSQYTIKKCREFKKESYLLFEVTTNGTLIDEEAIELFKKFNMRVLISIDGPENFHDDVRSYRNGDSSFGDVMTGISRMRDAGYPFRIITVVTRRHLAHTHEIMDFFAQLGLYDLRFNPVLRNGRGKSGWQHQGIAPHEYLAFMKTTADLCSKEVSLHEDNIQSILRNMVYRTRDFKCMRSNCGCGHYYLCVDADGDVYPCAYFLSETGNLRLGNIHERVNSWNFGEHHPLVKTFPSRCVDKIERCSHCQWRHLCEGGCTLGAYLNSGDISAPTYLCDYFKGMYTNIFNLLAQQPDFILGQLPEEVEVERI
ncbi:MAG TPA: radical SAM protein [Candidatus Deferrimicrobium sp.]|nr:radical SAM protein [Candidatus Deferrimicrobium sp.]